MAEQTGNRGRARDLTSPPVSRAERRLNAETRQHPVGAIPVAAWRTVSTMDSSQPTALIAGGSRGLGLLIARALLERGYQVAICARNDEELDRARQLLGVHGTVRAYSCDVRDREAVDQLVSSVTQELGPIEVLITVAGIIQVGPAETMTVDDYRNAVDTMTMGPVHLALAVLPGMRERRRGRIGTVTSVGGLVSPPHLLPYATAKFGAVGFSDGLAASLAGSGVTATTIAPGLMRTGSPERAYFSGRSEREYAWFAPAASLPLLSIDADRAARIMVNATLAGKPVVLVGWLPKVAHRVRGLAPGLTTRMLGVMNRLLPGAGDDPKRLVMGRDAENRLSSTGSKVVGWLSQLGTDAAKRNNER